MSCRSICSRAAAQVHGSLHVHGVGCVKGQSCFQQLQWLVSEPLRVWLAALAPFEHAFHTCLAARLPSCLPAVSSAQLTPADVYIDDIVEAAREAAAHSVNGSGPRLDFVVREVQACLGAWLHR